MKNPNGYGTINKLSGSRRRETLIVNGSKKNIFIECNRIGMSSDSISSTLSTTL